MKKDRIDPQTQKNALRLEEYRRRICIWTMVYGATHRAIKLRYFDIKELVTPRPKYFQPLTYPTNGHSKIGT